MKTFACLIVVCASMVLHARAESPSGTPAITASAARANYQLTIELRDGSRVIGRGLENSLSVHSAILGDMKLPWAGIQSIEYAGDGDAAHLTAANDDKFTVQVSVKALSLETDFGKIDLPLKLIRSIKVKPLANLNVGSLPEAGDKSGLQLTIELRDKSHLVGKGLDKILNFHSTSMGDLKLTWADIRSINFTTTDGDSAQLTGTNGDAYGVSFAGSTLQLETSFGKKELPVKLIRSIAVSKEGTGSEHLIGWWKLDEGVGNVAKDSSPNPHDGNLVNGPIWIKDSGPSEASLQFNGSNQHVSLGKIHQGAFKEISIACWEKHPRIASLQEILERGIWDDPDGIGLMMSYVNGSVIFGHYRTWVLSKADVQDDRWHHLVGTMSPSGTEFLYSIYVDGKLDNTAILPVGLTATSGGWAVGARTDGTWAYQGLISDLRIYDHALSPFEVQSIYGEHRIRESSLPTPLPEAGPKNRAPEVQTDAIKE